MKWWEKYRVEFDETGQHVVFENGLCGGVLVSWKYLFYEGDNVEPVAHINGDGIGFFPSALGCEAEKLWMEKTSGPKKRVQLERMFEHEDIIMELEAHGLPYERNKKCVFGVMDVFVQTSPPAIIEVKRSSDAHDVKKAVGQLALYSYEYPHAELYIACLGGLNPKYIPALEKWGMKEWKLDTLTK